MAIVNASNLNYPILIAETIYQQIDWALHIAGQQVCIVTNEKVANLYLNDLKKTLNKFQCSEIILPDGEQYKNFDSLQKIFQHLIENYHQRSTTIIGLGGGVILDIAGFAAACYQRGVNFISVPTSLLAQVDASVGGKTAINFQQTKNMIGAFYQPQAVLIDPSVLQTLAEREFRSGIAEMIKHGFIADKDYFIWLEKNIDKILQRDLPTLKQAIATNCLIKSKIVQQDEKEKNLRAILNFGHTIGHAIEAESHYEILHGEAVAIGMMLELPLSMQHGLAAETAARLKNLLEQAGLPTALPVGMEVTQLAKWLRHDKKTDKNQSIKMPLLKAIGKAYLLNCTNFYL